MGTLSSRFPESHKSSPESHKKATSSSAAAHQSTFYGTTRLNPPSAAQILGADVCESWDAMRRYLQESPECILLSSSESPICLPLTLSSEAS
eukprot:1187413-Amphidinium_carterae.1